MSQSKLQTKCQRLNVRGSGSYIDSPDWIKKKNQTTNRKNRDDKCFQFAVAVALNYEEIKWNPERVSNIKTFRNKYKWKRIYHPLKIHDWKIFEKNKFAQ